MIIDISFAETNSTMSVTLSDGGSFTTELTEDSSEFSAEFGSEEHPAYVGAYEVDPDFSGISLACENRYMTQDVTVNPIQVETVSNTGGGYTVYIGGIV